MPDMGIGRTLAHLSRTNVEHLLRWATDKGDAALVSICDRAFQGSYRARYALARGIAQGALPSLKELNDMDRAARAPTSEDLAERQARELAWEAAGRAAETTCIEELEEEIQSCR